jgi:hypothetical protein
MSTDGGNAMMLDGITAAVTAAAGDDDDEHRW